MMKMTDAEARKFLDRLDASEVDVTQWESDFLNSVFHQQTFSEKQHGVITRMEKQYGELVK